MHHIGFYLQAIFILCFHTLTEKRALIWSAGFLHSDCAVLCAQCLSIIFTCCLYLTDKTHYYILDTALFVLPYQISHITQPPTVATRLDACLFGLCTYLTELDSFTHSHQENCIVISEDDHENVLLWVDKVKQYISSTWSCLIFNTILEDWGARWLSG